MGGAAPWAGPPIIVPESWRLLRALLRSLGLLALVVATLSLTDISWQPGPLGVVYAVYLGLPVALVAGAVVVAVKVRRRRLEAFVVVAVGLLVIVLNVDQVRTIERVRREVAALAPRQCATAAACADLVEQKFGEDAPLVPHTAPVGGYRFRYAEESGGRLGFWYSPDRRKDPTVAFVIAKRKPDGFEPPADEASVLHTPNGVAYTEQRAGDRVTRLDAWDDGFHYLVAMQGGIAAAEAEHAVAIALIDGARRREVHR